MKTTIDSVPDGNVLRARLQEMRMHEAERKAKELVAGLDKGEIRAVAEMLLHRCSGVHSRSTQIPASSNVPETNE